MIKLENTEVLGWEAAIRGMRNPMNSWKKSDSWFIDYWNTEFEYYVAHSYVVNYARMIEALEDNYMDVEWEEYDSYKDIDGKEVVNKIKHSDHIYYPDLNVACKAVIGPNDHKLMMNLAKAGSVDAKYRRMIVVTVDITAPLYWWKEFDTYKIGTVANSCSTMHKIHAKEFTLEDFSCEHLMQHEEYIDDIPNAMVVGDFKTVIDITIKALNDARELYLKTKDKRFWWQLIQLLPSSYNQRRTVMLNYEVLAGIYPKRKDHKLDEWHAFCDWIKSLPYSEIITLEEN